MATLRKRELKWKDDVRASIPACKQALTRTAVPLALAWLIDLPTVWIHGTFMYFAMFVETLLLVPYTFALLKELSSEILISPCTTKLTNSVFWRLTCVAVIFAAVMVPSVVPIASVRSILLNHSRLGAVLVVGAIGFVSLFAVVPIAWWITKSSLANPLVCIEGTGVFGSLRTSHRMLNGHFWSSFNYLLPNLLFVSFPAMLLSLSARDCLRTLTPTSDPASIIGSAALYLVASIIALLAPMSTSLIQSVRLYAYVKHAVKTQD